MIGWIWDYMERYDYENLYFCQNKDVGLKAVIAIHDTTLGPATGGCRMWTYENENDAIEDALRLARGMTYKYAAAGVNLGGGKAVIIGSPKIDKSEALFRCLGRFIHSLGGRYYTGEDVGTTLQDMDYIRMETPYVVTLPESSGGAGPISPSTAFGVLRAIKACAETILGSSNLNGRKIAVQGVGSVGYYLVQYLVKEGARVIISDIDQDKVESVCQEFKVEKVSPDRIYGLDVDIFAPCALGAVVNDATLEQFNCRIICGSANNQLKTEKHGDILEQKGILYAPDYIVNAGGTIFDTDRLGLGGFNKERALKNVARIFDTTKEVIAIAHRENIPTYQAADTLAERRIENYKKVRNAVL